jgi:hypothetical protein
MSENTIPENENTAGKTTGAAEGQTANNSETVQTPETEAVAATAIIKIEGQEFPLDVAIAADDNLLKAALSPHYPSIKNAQISRETRAGQIIVSIVKKAEHKGIR